MKHILQKTIIITTGLAVLITAQIDAYCAKCEKIEQDREKEQAANPKPWNYYDDEVSLHSKNETASLDDRPATKKADKGSTVDSSRNAQGVESGEEKIQNKSNLTQASNLFSAYSTIYTIFKTKNFLEALDNSFTLFIPTDEAILSLPPRSLFDLTRAENAEKLAALVSNHVVAKKILTKDFTAHNNAKVKAISGKNLTLSSREGKLYIDNVAVIRYEASGNDGIIYVIDKVLGF